MLLPALTGRLILRVATPARSTAVRVNAHVPGIIRPVTELTFERWLEKICRVKRLVQSLMANPGAAIRTAAGSAPWNRSTHP